MKRDGSGRESGVSLFEATSEGTGGAPRRGTAPPAEPAELTLYAPPALVPRVLRRWRAIVALGLAAAVVAAVFGLVRPAEYRAEALVQLGSGTADLVTGTASPQDDLDRRIATETEIISSDRVRAAARAVVRRDLPPVEVTQQSTSSLLSVAVTTTDPEDAAGDADAYVEAYLQLTSARARDELEPAIGVLRDRLANIAATLDDLQALLADTPITTTGSDPATDAIQARVDNLLEQRSATNENIDRLEGAAAIGNLDVRSFADAVAPTSPASTPPLRLALLALVVGLVAGGVAAAAVPLGRRRTGG